MTTDNFLLANDTTKSQELGIYLHPAVSINNITYRGYLEGADIFDFICASFIKEPRVCVEETFSSEKMRTDIMDDFHEGKFSLLNFRHIIFSVIGVLLVLQIAFLIWYRRRKHN